MQQQQPTMIEGTLDNLPCELLTDIFLRLNVKDLVRCTCVCKSWYSLIVNPYFITAQVTQPSISKNPLLMVKSWYSAFFKGNNLLFENYTLHFIDETFSKYQKLRSPILGKIEPRQVVGSCNGLVCLYYYYPEPYVEKMLLWNPSIKKYMNLPPPGISRRIWRDYHTVSGFGYDLTHNDFKILRIVYPWKPKVCKVEHPPEAELYSLKARSWRSINGPTYYVYKSHLQQAYVNGAVHWLALDYGSYLPHIVLSFDMHDEVFGEVILPESVVSTYNSSTSINVLGESLCIFQHGWSELYIWVMKEYGVAESWSKQHTIGFDLLSCDRSNADISPHEALLASRGGDLTCYRQRIKESGMHFENICVYNYVESLILLNQGDGVLTTQTKGNKNRRRRRKKKKEEGARRKRRRKSLCLLLTFSVLLNFLVLLCTWELS